MARSRTSRKTAMPLPKVARRRSTWEQRTAVGSRAARILAKAATEKPVFIEDDDGHRMRQWKPEDLQRFTNDDIRRALRLNRTVEPESMLEFIPPSAIRYCQTKGWIVKDPKGAFFWVTRRAAAELDLPRQHQGRKIQFLKI
jgi:hypothetical protein